MPSKFTITSTCTMYILICDKEERENFNDNVRKE